MFEIMKWCNWKSDSKKLSAGGVKMVKLIKIRTEDSEEFLVGEVIQQQPQVPEKDYKEKPQEKFNTRICENLISAASDDDDDDDNLRNG